MKLQGKTAVVTGGGRDIGLACVKALAAEGANVAINYHSSADGANKAVEEITAAGGKAFAMQGDMTNEEEVQAFITRTVEEFGSIDIAMPITGSLVARVPTAEMTMAHWHTVMNVNATSCMLLIMTALPHFNKGGSIVTMASQAARDGGGPGAVAYAASKGAVLTMTRGWAKELGPDIRVNAMNPGMINTDFHNVFTKPEVREHVANVTPLKREGKPEDVANLAVYLASDDAAFITGACIDINGGMLFS